MPANDSSPASDLPSADVATHREPLSAYCEFAATALGLDHSVSSGVLDMKFDHREHPTWPKPYQAKVAVTAPTIAELPRRVMSPADGSQWLWKLAQLSHGALIGRPASQPEAVHEFSDRLFNAYQVDGGQIHLAGCHISEVPFVRITLQSTEDATEIEHQFYDSQGQPVSESLIAELGLAEVAPLASQATTITRPQIEAALANCDTDADRFVAATVVTAKRAEGALQFDVGNQCAQVAFNQWTRTLAAPPFRCAATNTDTFHLAAVDDGRIVAAEAIDVCQQSGARVVGIEMATCEVTGKRVDPQLVATCPISGSTVLESELIPCDACNQSVSRTSRTGGICQACRNLPSARPTDTCVAELIERFPMLKQYRKFQAGEAGGLVRVMAVGLWQRLLVVCPAGSTTPQVIAMRQGFAGPWKRVQEADQRALLGQSKAESA